MQKKDLILRFLLGGTAVMLRYMVTVISPWKILSGIFAAFPAVMLSAVFMVGLASGSYKAANIAKSSVYGMIGGVICVTTVLIVLQASGNWFFSIFLGLTLWFGSSIAVSALRDRLRNSGIRRA